MSRVTPIVALDVPEASAALRLVEELGTLCGFYKVGSELFTSEGPAVVRVLRERGARVFLDLKYHDIPNTVKSAARAASALGANLLTVHASGGASMVRAAVDGAGEGGGDCLILAVTVLTSMDETQVAAVWGRRIESMQQEVLRLAALAVAGGAHGIVCSGREAAEIRARHGDALATLVPGVRLAGSGAQDQVRVVTPRQAADAGARYIVLGRTVTGAESPVSAMREVLADLS